MASCLRCVVSLGWLVGPSLGLTREGGGRQPVLLFSHVPKVGGSSVSGALVEISKALEVGHSDSVAHELLDGRADSSPCIDDLNPSGEYKYQYLSDEMGVTQALKIEELLRPCADVAIVSLFRDPTRCVGQWAPGTFLRALFCQSGTRSGNTERDHRVPLHLSGKPVGGGGLSGKTVPPPPLLP
jgi:hypothetical protein